MEGEVEFVVVYFIIELRYEYCVLKYYDFFYEEIEEDIVLVESWFNNVIFYEVLCIIFICWILFQCMNIFVYFMICKIIFLRSCRYGLRVCLRWVYFFQSF